MYVKGTEIDNTLAGFLGVVPKKGRISTRTNVRASRTWSIIFRIKLENMDSKIPNCCFDMQPINLFSLKCGGKSLIYMLKIGF